MSESIPAREPTTTEIAALLDDLDATLHNVWYWARFCSDIAGREATDIRPFDAEAVSTAMHYFADETEAARQMIDTLQGVIHKLPDSRDARSAFIPFDGDHGDQAFFNA